MRLRSERRAARLAGMVAVTSHDTELLIWAVIAIAGIVALMSVLKMHAFVALMVGSIFVGLVAGLGPTSTVTSSRLA
jgi:gluconate:H+ symporter, GntP family